MIKLCVCAIGCRWLFYSALPFSKVVLIAPDGICQGWLYRQVVETRFFAWLFGVFGPAGLRLFKRYVPRFKLTTAQVFYQWKLLKLFLFPSFCAVDSLVVLSPFDRLIPSEKVRKKYFQSHQGRVVYHDCNHFALPVKSVSEVADFFQRKPQGNF